MTRNKDLVPDMSGKGDQTRQRLEEVLWVIEARAGDMAAFTRLVTRYEKPLLYYLRRFISDGDAAWDAYQDVWLDAYRGLSKLSAPEAFRVWLYRIAHSKVARFIQQEIRCRSHHETLMEGHDRAIDTDEPDYDAELVHWGLQQLPAEFREVLALRYLEDLSLEEIAAIADAPTGTVKSRLHYARLTLKRILERKFI